MHRQLESTVERKLVDSLKRIGIPCVKMSSEHRMGMPDRLVILPNGEVEWVELKTDGGVLSEMQKFRHAELERMGHRVSVLWNAEMVEDYVARIKRKAENG